MPGVTLKNIPEPLYERSVETARLHHRSLTKEIVFALEHYVDQPSQDKSERLGRIERYAISTPRRLPDQCSELGGRRPAG